MPKGFSAHPPAMYNHAANVSQRGHQLSSHGQAISGTGVHSGTYGPVGASTATSHQQFNSTAAKAWGKAGSQLNNQANLVHKSGQRVANTDSQAASKFKQIGDYGKTSAKGPGGGYGAPKGGGGHKKPYDPSKYVPKPKPQPKPKPPKPKPPKPKPQPNPNPWQKKAWYDNKNYLSSYDTQKEFSQKYPNYWQNREHIKNNVLTDPKLRKKYGDIDTADLVGVRGYTTNDYYRTVNQALRNGDTATVKKYESNVKTAVSGLNGMPRYDGWTVRKIQVPPGYGKSELGGVLDRYSPGKQVQEHTFVSTTAGHTNNFDGNVVMHIKSSYGRPIQDLSKYPTEGEVLFGPGTRYNVADRWYDPADKTHHVKMYEAP